VSLLGSLPLLALAPPAQAQDVQKAREK